MDFLIFCKTYHKSILLSRYFSISRRLSTCVYNTIRLSRHETYLFILVHDKHTCSWRVNLLYYEHWTDKQKYFYVYQKTLANIRKLEKTVIKYSSYTNHLHFSLRFHHSKILPKDPQPKSRIKTERSKIILKRASKLLL